MASMMRPKSSDLPQMGPPTRRERTSSPIEKHEGFCPFSIQLAIFFYHLLSATDMHCAASSPLPVAPKANTEKKGGLTRKDSLRKSFVPGPSSLEDRSRLGPR